jgi:U3 small nucleolar RNA-associated protein 12
VQAELCVRLTVCLLKAHHSKLMASPASKQILAEVQHGLRAQVRAMKNLIGFNMAGLTHIKQSRQAWKELAEH